VAPRYQVIARHVRQQWRHGRHRRRRPASRRRRGGKAAADGRTTLGRAREQLPHHGCGRRGRTRGESAEPVKEARAGLPPLSLSLLLLLLLLVLLVSMAAPPRLP
jgi:hypothetical protein